MLGPRARGADTPVLPKRHARAVSQIQPATAAAPLFTPSHWDAPWPGWYPNEDAARQVPGLSMGQRCCHLLTYSPRFQPVTCLGSLGNQQQGQHHHPPSAPGPESPGTAAQRRPTLPKAQPSPAFYLCNLGDTRDLAKFCQGDPFMQRLHFGPSRAKETSRHQGASEAKRHQLHPPLASPGGARSDAPPAAGKWCSAQLVGPG